MDQKCKKKLVVKLRQKIDIKEQKIRSKIDKKKFQKSTKKMKKNIFALKLTKKKLLKINQNKECRARKGRVRPQFQSRKLACEIASSSSKKIFDVYLVLL